jgi:hypothetical protein
VLRAVLLARKCLTGDPKSHPSMDDVVAMLEDIEALQQEAEDTRTCRRGPNVQLVAVP